MDFMKTLFSCFRVNGENRNFSKTMTYQYWIQPTARKKMVFRVTGDNDLKTILMDANFFWKQREKDSFSNENGYLDTGPKSNLEIHTFSKHHCAYTAWVCRNTFSIVYTLSMLINEKKKSYLKTLTKRVFQEYKNCVFPFHSLPLV